jgi:DNA-binding MarR family transcriptional regulator
MSDHPQMHIWGMPILRARQVVLDAVERRERMTITKIADRLDVSRRKLVAMLQAFDEGGMAAVLRGPKTVGRPPVAQPTEQDLQRLREAKVLSNRGEGLGSTTFAARYLAKTGKLSESTTNAILFKGGDPAQGERASKHDITKRLRRLMDVPPAIIAEHRAPRNRRLGGIFCPGALRLTHADGGARLLHPGEVQSWDDASINTVVWVPFIHGGDPCSDKFGKRVGRFQLLSCVDHASDFCPGYSFVMRAKSSYRKEDVARAMRDAWRKGYMPESVVLEGGAWQSDMIMRMIEALGVGFVDAKGRPHEKLVELLWGRTWTGMPLELSGQIGRFRGEMERENAQLVRVQQGRLDPEGVFPGLDEMLPALDRLLEYQNNDVSESKTYGKWTRAERHNAYLAEHPRPAIPEELCWLFAPEQRCVLVRRGMAMTTCPSPFGESFPYAFTHPELYEFDGKHVRVHFDPFEDPLRATIVLLDEYRGLKPGHVITHHAQSMSSPGEIIEHAEGKGVMGYSEETLGRAMQLRKAQHMALRTEFRSFGFGGRKKVEATEIRGPDGSMLKTETGGPDGVIVRSTGAHHEAMKAVAALRREDATEEEVAALEKMHAEELGIYG